MKKIGITGGIGSGKTTICEIFKLLGVAVFQADEVGRNLQMNDVNIKKQLIHRFGEDIYAIDGLLNRKKLADRVFSDPKALADLNGIIHPAVRQTFLNWVEMHRNDPYVIYEAAILFESGYVSDFDKIILVMANEEIRIKRVIGRDQTSRSLVEKRIKNQMSDNRKKKLADYVIENNNKELIIPQIIDLDRLLLQANEINV